MRDPLTRLTRREKRELHTLRLRLQNDLAMTPDDHKRIQELEMKAWDL